MEKTPMYVGSANEIGGNGLRVQLDLTELAKFTKGEAKEKIRTWKDKFGIEHRTIDLVIFPLNPLSRTQYRTHSVKVSDYEKPQEQQKPVPAQVSGDDMPF